MKNKLRKDEPRDFKEFAEWATRELHNSLLREGSRGMNGVLYEILPYYKDWSGRV